MRAHRAHMILIVVQRASTVRLRSKRNYFYSSAGDGRRVRYAMKVRGQVHNWRLHSPHLTVEWTSCIRFCSFQFHLQQNVVYLFTILSFCSFFAHLAAAPHALAPMHSLLIFVFGQTQTHTAHTHLWSGTFCFSRAKCAHVSTDCIEIKREMHTGIGHRAPAQNEFTYALHSSFGIASSGRAQPSRAELIDESRDSFTGQAKTQLAGARCPSGRRVLYRQLSANKPLCVRMHRCRRRRCVHSTRTLERTQTER